MQGLAKQRQALSLQGSKLWHTLGELDKTALKNLRGHVKRPKTQIQYYMVAAEESRNCYSAVPVTVTGSDERTGEVTYSRLDGISSPSTPSAEDVPAEDDILAQWNFADAPKAIAATTALNNVLEMQRAKLDGLSQAQ